MHAHNTLVNVVPKKNLYEPILCCKECSHLHVCQKDLAKTQVNVKDLLKFALNLF